MAMSIRATASLLRQTGVRRASGVRAECSRRAFHAVPALDNHETYAKTGVANLMSPETYDLAWNKYQSYVIDELNKRVVGTQFENMSVFDIMISTARHSDQAAIFNFASLAHNNHFFFDGIRGPADAEASSTPLARTAAFIDVSFTEPAELKDHMKAITESMTGNGFVWLLEGPSKRLYLTATYNAGTPYDYARTQDVDLNVPVSDSRFKATQARQSDLLRGKLSGMGAALPLLCLNVFEHAYVNDYGFANRSQYFENWWSLIDWSKVERRLESNTPSYNLNRKRL